MMNCYLPIDRMTKCGFRVITNMNNANIGEKAIKKHPIPSR